MFYNTLLKFLKKFNIRDNFKILCYYTVTVSKYPRPADSIFENERMFYIMKRYLKYTAAAVSAVTMAASAVPAMAAQVVVSNGKQQTVTAEETKKEDAKTEEAKTEETKTEETKTETPAAETTTAETTATAPAEETIGYTALTGKITAVAANEDGSVRITFQNEERGEIIFNETADCMVIADGAVKSVKDLAEGMEVTIVMDDLAPMTMSIPPQTSGAVAIVVNGETPVFTAVDKFDDELTGKTLKLTMDDKVQVLDVRGTKQVLTADDVKGHKAVVVYTTATKSIPAQTTPSFVIILDNAEETAAHTETTETKTTETTTEKAEITNLPLRATLEAMGYTIEWTANDAPIVVTKGNVKAEIAIDSDTVVVDGDQAHKLSANVVLVDGVTYIPSDAMDFLK